MKKYIILFLLLVGCTPKIEIPVLPTLTPLPTYAPNITPDVIPTLSPEAQEFQDTVDYYEKHILGCLAIEAGEYESGDTAGLLFESLRDDQSLFKNKDFVKAFTVMMDDIETYCTNNAATEPEDRFDSWFFRELNWDLLEADEEYYQYQRQGRLGIENGDMSLIESAFNHRDNAHEAMRSAAYYYEDLFEYYGGNNE